MSAAHMHLVLNHIPLISLPIALFFLVHASGTKNDATYRLSLGVLIALATITVPVFLTGEPAEDVVENINGIAESTIETHELAAKFALVWMLVIGGLASLALVRHRKQKPSRFLYRAILVAGAFALATLARTSFLGGRIRHTEFIEAKCNTSESIAQSAESNLFSELDGLAGA